MTSYCYTGSLSYNGCNQEHLKRYETLSEQIVQFKKQFDVDAIFPKSIGIIEYKLYMYLIIHYEYFIGKLTN